MASHSIVFRGIDTVEDLLNLTHMDPTIKALGLLKGFKKSADWTLLSSFCDDSNLHISVFK